MNDDQADRDHQALLEATAEAAAATRVAADGPDAFCPTCSTRLVAHRCKLLCPTTGCGYLVSCSEV